MKKVINNESGEPSTMDNLVTLQVRGRNKLIKEISET